MFKFACISGYDQLVITSNNKSDSSGEGKWAKQKRDVFHADSPKVYVTTRHIYAAYLNSLIVLDTKPLTDSPSDNIFETKKEFKIECHASPITCFAVEETCYLVCSCSDESVCLSKWDALLGHWDTKCISEDDGRILSCSVTYKDCAVYIALFKSDIVLVYKTTSAHPPQERGPLILNSIECLTSLEKIRELTTWSKSLFFRETLNVIGVACGNTVAMKHYEMVTEEGQLQLKLKSHRMVSYLKTIAGADVHVDKDIMFVLIVGVDGESEVYFLTTDVFNLLYRFKIEEPVDPTPQISMNNQNQTGSMQVEWRILCAKFFPCVEDTAEISKKVVDDEIIPVQNGQKIPLTANIDSGLGGDGDAKFCLQEFEKLNFDEKDALLLPDCEVMNADIGLKMCPKLIVSLATTRGVLFIDIISGQNEPIVSYGELLKDDTIFIQNAQMAVDGNKKEVILGLQSCLARIVFSRRFLVKNELDSEKEVESRVSLIPREALSSRSVLRKKIKSPPRQPPTYPVLKLGRATGFPKGASPPSWARSKSRPHQKSSNLKPKHIQPLSARSNDSMSSKGLQHVDSGESLTDRKLKIPATGSYENEELMLHKCKKMVMSTSSAPHGISLVRLAATASGKHLAFGGNISPLIITKTQPFQHHRIFKDITKITCIDFNFTGNLLLVATSDCRTTLVDWQSYKELMSFEFSTKFNDHVHSQFYFMDKFIIQPEANKLAMYSYAKRDTGYIKLKAGEFTMPGQNITAMKAANQFYSNMIITGLSNKSIQIFDTNAETISVNIPNAHAKPISCIRINEAPKGPHATSLCDVFLTSSFSSLDPIKLWDLRSERCIMRISDVNQSAFVPTSRPNLSPCGRYIVSGFEDNNIAFYDVRKIITRLHTIRKVGSTILDCCFDANQPMVWSGCRNGSILNFYIP